MALPRFSSEDSLSLATTSIAPTVLMESCSRRFLQRVYIEVSKPVPEVSDKHE